MVGHVGPHVGGVGERLQLVEQRGVGLPDRLPQPLGEVLQLGRAVLLGDGLAQRAVGVGEVAQRRPLGPGQLVAADEVRERHALLVHLPHHRLRRQRVLRQPRVGLPVDLVRRLQKLDQRPRPGDRLQQRHPLVVLDPVGLHLRDRLAARGVLLGHPGCR